MKKLSVIIMSLALSVFTIGQVSAQNTMTSSADNQETKQAAGAKQDCGKFVDNNKDGVCDNHAAKVNEGKGENFVDANGDGICDHHADGTTCKGNGNCCKQNGQQNQNCSKEAGAQHRHGCENQCPNNKTPDKK